MQSLNYGQVLAMEVKKVSLPGGRGGMFKINMSQYVLCPQYVSRQTQTGDMDGQVSQD